MAEDLSMPTSEVGKLTIPTTVLDGDVLYPTSRHYIKSVPELPHHQTMSTSMLPKGLGFSGLGF